MVTPFSAHCISDQKVRTVRDAEAGGILGVNTPSPLFWAYTPTFWTDLKMGVREGTQQKLGGGKNFRGGKKFFRGINEGKMGG